MVAEPQRADRRGQRARGGDHLLGFGGARRAERAADHARGGCAGFVAYDGSCSDSTRRIARGASRRALLPTRRRVRVASCNGVDRAAPRRCQFQDRRRAVHAALWVGRNRHLRPHRPWRGQARTRQ